MFDKAQLTKVYIDKFSATLKIPLNCEKNMIKDKLIELENDSFARKIYNRSYRSSYSIFLDDALDHKLFIQCDPVLNSSFLRVEYNPKYLYFDQVFTFLDHIIPGGYQRYLDRAVCTRVDCTVDIMGIHIDELIIFKPKVHKTRLFTDANSFMSYYLGDIHSPRQICIYDKVAEINSKNKKLLIKEDLPKLDITRIESRIRDRHFVNELGEMNNAFSGISISSYDIKHSDNDMKLLINLFVDSCRYRGPQSALKLIKHYDESKYQIFKKILKESEVSWWDVEDIWKSWPTAVDELTKEYTKPFSLDNKTAEIVVGAEEISI